MRLFLSIFLCVSLLLNSFGVCTVLGNNNNTSASFLTRSMFNLQCDEIHSIDDSDTFNFENWKSGTYSYTTGKYCENTKKLCLREYVSFGYNKYKAVITESCYTFAIRELDKDKNFIRKCSFLNGQVYVPSQDAKYLAIGIENYKLSSGINYDTYKGLFKNGFQARLEPVVSAGKVESNINQEPSTEEVKTNNIESYDLKTFDINNFDAWRSGAYGTKSGMYVTTQSKICLTKYITFEGQKYNVYVSNTEYALMIQEMDKSGEYIRTVYPSNSKVYIPNSNAKYLAITLYNKVSGAGLTYSKYKSLFDEGIIIKFYNVIGEINIGQSSSEPIPQESTQVSTNEPTQAQTQEVIQTPGQNLSLYDTVLQMLYDGNTGNVDISKYRCTQDYFNNYIWTKLQKENALEFFSYYKIKPIFTLKGNYITHISISNIDEGGKARIVKGRKKLNEFLSQIDSKMTKLDKLLMAHDFIVDSITYKTGDLVDHCAGGPLGNGYGACDGISQAIQVLLIYVDVESIPVTSYNMNHGWLLVKIDNQWYHVDATWDYNYITNRGYGKHMFLIRNDSEFISGLGKNHYDWTCYSRPGTTSTSTKFTNWFVHDVSDNILYYNGYWYYADANTKSIVKTDVYGKNSSTLITSNGFKVKVISIDSGVLTYTQGNITKTIMLQ